MVLCSLSHNDLVKLSQVTDGLLDFSKIWQFCAELKLFTKLLIASIVALVTGIQDAPLDTSDRLLLVRRPRRGKRGREEREETEKKIISREIIQMKVFAAET